MVERTRNTTGSVPEQKRPLNCSSHLLSGALHCVAQHGASAFYSFYNTYWGTIRQDAFQLQIIDYPI